MKKFFILTIGLILFFCVTIAQAETEDNTTAGAKQWWEDGYVRPPKVEEPTAPVEAVTPDEAMTSVEASALKVEDAAVAVEVVSPKAEEPAASTEVTTANVEEPAPLVDTAAPAIADRNLAPKSSKEGIQNLINKWLTSWQSGDMENYRSFYASDFKSKGKNLDAWVAQKTAIHSKNKNVKISIDDLQIVAEENIASAAFIERYSSSTNKNSGKKILKFKKINNEWKIDKEII